MKYIAFFIGFVIGSAVFWTYIAHKLTVWSHKRWQKKMNKYWEGAE